jgi:hypothetical protein
LIDGTRFSPHEYLKAIARRERSKLTSAADVTDDTDDALRRENLSVLAKFEAISSHLLPREDDLNRPTLWHWDIRPPNLFVENGRISSIIDWQDVWVGPLSLQARRPRLVDYHGEMVLRFPDNYEEITDADEKGRITDRVEKSIILWCYDNEMKKENPALHKLFNLPQIEKRNQAVTFASELSHGDVIPLRGCLIDLSRCVALSSADHGIETPLTTRRRWDELETGLECPIQFSPSEMRSHDEDAKAWNENANFWSSLDGFVSRDGWTSLENYQDAFRFLQELRDQGLSQLSGSDLVDFEQQSRWVTKDDDR